MSTAPLTLVATYRRTIHASLERIWENVRDWEHLPWLHRSSFSSIRLLEQTPDSWRARITMPPASAPREAVIELQLDQANRRYWSRTLEGQGTGGEILTCLKPLDERTTDIVVEFWVSGVSAKQAEAVGAAYLRLYARLWDEDERMMMRRQELIDSRRINVEPRVLRKVENKE
ncbi:MAG TPA: hypothetical protein VGX03_04830 [Candidatus Binatia bacterium]|jgi:hypothetical protein|nr:hypothetical protein [Candidatus Binatia bacterium]